MVGVFGTVAADVLHVGLGVPYVVSTTLYAIVLTAVFMTWQRSELTLSIHSILTRRRELFYWAAVLATFALGTAAGDMTARTLGLGYLGSGVMFAVLIAVPAVAYRRFGMNAVLAFWFAYIVTRPLGASFADWMAVPHNRGGLGFGYGPVSIVLAVLIVAFVAYLASSRIDIAQLETAASSRRSRGINHLPMDRPLHPVADASALVNELVADPVAGDADA
jgi:uncharacterized membrane-anchored protein